jgi:hypothetical protein
LDTELCPCPLRAAETILFHRHFFSESMTDQRALPVMASKRPDFEVVCINCDTLGIVIDCPEGAPFSTEIKCRHCGSLRGTLGDLRSLSSSGRRDLFEVSVGRRLSNDRGQQGW